MFRNERYKSLGEGQIPFGLDQRAVFGMASHDSFRGGLLLLLGVIYFPLFITVNYLRFAAVDYSLQTPSIKYCLKNFKTYLKKSSFAAVRVFISERERFPLSL